MHGGARGGAAVLAHTQAHFDFARFHTVRQDNGFYKRVLDQLLAAHDFFFRARKARLEAGECGVDVFIAFFGRVNHPVLAVRFVVIAQFFQGGGVVLFGFYKLVVVHGGLAEYLGRLFVVFFLFVQKAQQVVGQRGVRTGAHGHFQVVFGQAFFVKAHLGAGQVDVEKPRPFFVFGQHGKHLFRRAVLSVRQVGFGGHFNGFAVLVVNFVGGGHNVHRLFGVILFQRNKGCVQKRLAVLRVFG